PHVAHMPNRFTATPTGAVPPLPRWSYPVVELADVFMIVMLSRPSTGSLRRTWVTPATGALCAAAAVGLVVVGVLAMRGSLSGQPILWTATALAFALAIATACVAV